MVSSNRTPSSTELGMDIRGGGRKSRSGSYFKRHDMSLWTKVRAFDFMLCTQGNTTNIAALEKAMELNDFSQELERYKAQVERVCHDIDTLSEGSNEVKWNQESFDEWDTIRSMGCKLNRQTLAEEGPQLFHDTPVPDMPEVPEGLQVDDTLQQLEKLSEALRAPPLGQPSAAHVPPSFVALACDLHSTQSCPVPDSLVSLRETLDALMGKEQAHCDPDPCSGAAASFADDIPDVPRDRLPHVDAVWSHRHRQALGLALERIATAEEPGSYGALATQICDVSQRLVKETVVHLQDSAERCQHFVKRQAQDEQVMSHLLTDIDTVTQHRQRLARQCQSDIDLVTSTMEREEERYQADFAQYREKADQYKAMAQNTQLISSAFDSLVDLLQQRYHLVRRRVEEEHRQARKEGEIREFRHHAEVHTNRLRDYLEKNQKYVGIYTQQREACCAIREAYKVIAREKERAMYSHIVDAHIEHLHGLETLRCAMVRNTAAKQQNMDNVARVAKRLEKERDFCRLTSDVREAELSDDLAFLRSLQDGALRLVAKMQTRLGELFEQAQWSERALHDTGITPPKAVCLGAAYHGHNDEGVG